MNIGELRELIKDMPDEWPVILQKDAEGNGYSPLADVEENLYEAYNTWSGEAYMTDEKLAEKMASPNTEGWSEDDAAPEGSVRVLLLSPVN